MSIILKLINMKRNLNNPDDKKRLIELLLECPSLKDVYKRQSVLTLLPSHIADNILIGNTTTEYVINIVNACIEYPDAIEHLFDAIRFFDEKTIPFDALLSEFNLDSIELGPKTPPPELGNIEKTITALMAQLHLSSQVRASDEFTQHNHNSLQLIREAMVQLKQLSPQTPEYSRVSLSVGSALSSTGELLQAERLFIQVIENTNNRTEQALAHFNLFQVQLRRKVYSKALENLQAAIKLYPHYALHDLHKYPLERLLGAGGMGCVFLCQNRNRLIRYERVVVKCFWEPPKGTLDEVFKEPFAMRDIAGDYIPEPLDFGYVDVIKQERAYFVTAYIDDAIDGEAWLEKYGPMNLETGLEVGLQMAKGLQIAHKKGIYHLDLKPANILLVKKTFEVSKTSKVLISVKIIDFGLSQVATSLQQKAIQHSRTGLSTFGQAIFGTLDYASPEQRGVTQYGKPSAKSDIFAFGKTLYKLLTGQNPNTLHPKRLKKAPELFELLCDCVEEEPQLRPESAQQLVNFFEKNQKLKKQAEIEKQRQVEMAQQKAEEEKQRQVQIAQQKAEEEEEKRDQAELVNQQKTFTFEVVTVNRKGKITHKQKWARYETEDLGSGITLEMVQIPKGSFMMGSPKTEEGRADAESPQHRVRVPPFLMGKYPVTQAQWQVIMGNNPSNFQGENRPVERVLWEKAVQFCQCLSEKTGQTYRLPSEAEWEYACRAGTTTPFYFGETITTDLANYDGNYPYASSPKGIFRKETTDVGHFPPNAFGLYDMHGNVWEWCADPWHDTYKGAPFNGSVWEKGGVEADFVLRGGSWDYFAGRMRSANRNRRGVINRKWFFGFRLARGL